MGARYYDPVTAQFLTRDPAFAQSGSAYGYAGNDPIDSLDPSGLGFCLLTHHAGGGRVGGNPGTDLAIAGSVVAVAGLIVLFASGVGEVALAAVGLDSKLPRA